MAATNLFPGTSRLRPFLAMPSRSRHRLARPLDDEEGYALARRSTGNKKAQPCRLGLSSFTFLGYGFTAWVAWFP
jgi:hypothetical protein